jgi:hypothetical protein
MAKVMISVPDALLERVDAHASAAGETRSGFLQRLAEREVEAVERRDDEEVGRLLDSIRIEVPADDPSGGDIVRMIREDRDSR